MNYSAFFQYWPYPKLSAAIIGACLIYYFSFNAAFNTVLCLATLNQQINPHKNYTIPAFQLIMDVLNPSLAKQCRIYQNYENWFLKIDKSHPCHPRAAQSWRDLVLCDIYHLDSPILDSEYALHSGCETYFDELYRSIYECMFYNEIHAEQQNTSQVK